MSAGIMRTPRSLDLEITSRCNASCRYCYYLNNPDVDYTDLPTERWLTLFDELGRCQVMEVTLQGGEPLLREDFLTLVDGIVANRMRFSILTNGSQLTPEIAMHLKTTGRCNQIQVSLDGSKAAIHESLRGADTFAPALAAIKLLQEIDLPVTVRVTVHPGNISDLPALARLLLDDMGLPCFSTNSTSSLGTSEKYGSEVFLNAADRLKAIHLLADLDSQYPGRIQANAGPLADWRLFNAMEDARQKGQPIPGRGCLVGCGCIFDKMAVRSDGVYVPCVMLPQMVLGEMGQDALADVWVNAAELKCMRERVKVPLASFEECRDCQWQKSCTGNCPGTAFTLTGEINRPCPDSCLKSFVQELADQGLSLWK
ncbi:MAG: SynChlorMet cassette radical SAM/SPASM protein ScmE [Desulfuromonadales bacterium]|nr:SynChlorMet cassette radical SAM/SPASM protein ScmE [Desulfuromonadales bacterium]